MRCNSSPSLDQLTAAVQEGVVALRDGDEFKRRPRASAASHDYSWGNSPLIVLRER